MAAADTGGKLHHFQGGCHQAPQAHKSAPERLEIPGGLHPEPVVDPITPCVLLAPVEHVIILATLKRLAQGPGPDSMGYFGVPTDETFPPALLELEEGLHHFGQATEAGSCSGQPSGEALQPAHWHLHLLPHFHGRGHLMRELANRRTMHGLVVGARTCPTPTSPE